MYATTANSVWPATVQAVAYAQVGDFFKLLVQRKGSSFAACEFCRTVNSRYTVRCRTCGGSLSPPNEEDAAPESEKTTRKPFSDARALRSVLTMVLVPPLLLFVSFGAWHQMQFEDFESTAAIAKPLSPPVTGTVIHPVAAAIAHRSLTPEQLSGKKINDREEVVGGALVSSSIEVQAQIPDRDLNEISRAHPGSVAPQASKSSPSRSRNVTAGLGRERQNVLAGCSGLSFLARAVCVNNRCAEPGAARLGQCRDAVRQRRIDEARRNPVLMG